MFRFDSALIQKRRKAAGLSLAKLSVLTADLDPKGKGVSPMTCMRIEKDNADPTTSSLMMICSALGISPKSAFVKIKN